MKIIKKKKEKKRHLTQCEEKPTAVRELTGVAIGAQKMLYKKMAVQWQLTFY